MQTCKVMLLCIIYYIEGRLILHENKTCHADFMLPLSQIHSRAIKHMKSSKKIIYIYTLFFPREYILRSLHGRVNKNYKLDRIAFG